MSLKTVFKKSFLFLGIAAVVTLGGCEREANPADESREELEARINFSKEMTPAEFATALDLLQHPQGAPERVEPQLQGLTSNKTYTVTTQNHARITIAGAAYDRPIDQWLAGASAGNVPISGEAFAALNDEVPHLIRVQIGDNPYWWWPEFALRTITLTMLDKGNYVIQGIYNNATNEYLFLTTGPSGSGMVGNTSCGAITFGNLFGHVYRPTYNVLDAELSYGFIAGCAPVVVGASVMFFLDGTANP